MGNKLKGTREKGKNNNYTTLLLRQINKIARYKRVGGRTTQTNAYLKKTIKLLISHDINADRRNTKCSKKKRTKQKQTKNNNIKLTRYRIATLSPYFSLYAVR